MAQLKDAYDKIITGGLKYNDLLILSETDLRGALIDCGFKSLSIGRIIGVLRENEQTTIYKAFNSSKKEIVHVVLSSAEEKSIQDITNKSQQVSKILKDIDEEVTIITKNANHVSQNIQARFAEIRDKVDQREQYLLSQLQNKADEKTKRLQHTKNEFVEYQNELNQIYKNTQSLIRDSSMDSSKIHQKKIKITTTAASILNHQTASNIPTFTINKSKIVETIDINDISNMLSTIGKIEVISGPLPPIIEIMSENAATVLIKLHPTTSDITHNKIQYIRDNEDVKSNDANDDHETNIWKSQEVQSVNSNLVTIKSLIPDTTYLIRAASKNPMLWGQYSKSITFQTKPLILPKEDKFNQISDDKKLKRVRSRDTDESDPSGSQENAQSNSLEMMGDSLFEDLARFFRSLPPKSKEVIWKHAIKIKTPEGKLKVSDLTEDKKQINKLLCDCVIIYSKVCIIYVYTHNCRCLCTRTSLQWSTISILYMQFLDRNTATLSTKKVKPFVKKAATYIHGKYHPLRRDQFENNGTYFAEMLEDYVQVESQMLFTCISRYAIIIM